MGITIRRGILGREIFKGVKGTSVVQQGGIQCEDIMGMNKENQGRHC